MGCPREAAEVSPTTEHCVSFPELSSELLCSPSSQGVLPLWPGSPRPAPVNRSSLGGRWHSPRGTESAPVPRTTWVHSAPDLPCTCSHGCHFTGVCRVPREPGDRLVTTRRSRATPTPLDIQADDVPFTGRGGAMGPDVSPTGWACALRSLGTSSHLHQAAKGVGCGCPCLCDRAEHGLRGEKKSRFKFRALCFPAW